MKNISKQLTHRRINDTVRMRVMTQRKHKKQWKKFRNKNWKQINQNPVVLNGVH